MVPQRPAVRQPAVQQPAAAAAKTADPVREKPAPHALPSPASIELVEVKKLGSGPGGGGPAHVAWAPDGRRLAVARYFFEIWDTVTGERMRRFAFKEPPVRSLAWSRQGELAITELFSRKVSIWKDDVMRQFAVPGIADAGAVAWSPVGDDLAVGDDVGNVSVLDARKGRETGRFRCGDSKLITPHMAWSPDGNFIAARSGNGVAIWSSATGAHVRTLPGQRPAWSRDGRYLAVCDGEGIRIWDPAVGAMLRTLAFSHRDRPEAEWTDDSRYVVAFRRMHRFLALWDAESGTQLSRWPLDQLAGIGLSPVGKQVAIITEGAMPQIHKIIGI
jgi:WD40 repeat protein